jgi:hypothetical protein
MRDGISPNERRGFRGNSVPSPKRSVRKVSYLKANLFQRLGQRIGNERAQRSCVPVIALIDALWSQLNTFGHSGIPGRNNHH